MGLGWRHGAWAAAAGLGVAIATAAAPHSDVSVWSIDRSLSSAHFAVRYLTVVTIRGRFCDIEGHVDLDSRHLTHSHVEALIHVPSLFTGDAARDRTLLGPNFFDADRFAVISFRSTEMVWDPRNDHLLVGGILEIRGVSRPVMLDVDGPTPSIRNVNGERVRALTAHLEIDRRDYGMVWNECLPGGGVVVGDRIAIELDITLTPARPAGALSVHP